VLRLSNDPIADEVRVWQELARTVHIDFVADLEALDKDLDDLRSKVKNLSLDAFAQLLEKYEAVRDRIRAYATLLSLQQERLPEAPVSVAAVSQREPARRTESPIAGLLDDNTNTLF